MSSVFNLGGPIAEPENIYESIGFSRNPFTPKDDESAPGPFFTGHITEPIDHITRWLFAAMDENVPALSVKGTIGAGKTRLLREIQRSVLSVSAEKKVHAGYVFLNKTGYTRPSVGLMLLDALDSFRPAWLDGLQTPTGVMPLIWAILRSGYQVSGESLVAQAILNITRLDSQEEGARLLNRWLHKDALTGPQSQRIGLYGRLDYEGQLPDIVCELLTIASSAGVLKKLFFIVDQLEDLVTPSYSVLRQSRILTDLRTLVDKEDAGVPLALVLSWSPDIDDPLYGFDDGAVDRTLQLRYSALYSRLTRNMVVLDRMREIHAPGFASEYISALDDSAKAERRERVTALFLAERAWNDLRAEGKAGDNKVTPRDLLSALETATQRVALERSAKQA